MTSVICFVYLGITVPLQGYDIPLPRQQPNNPAAAGPGIAAEISVCSECLLYTNIQKCLLVHIN